MNGRMESLFPNLLVSTPMQIERDNTSGNVIRSFSTGELRINDNVFTAPVIITAETIIDNWSPAGFTALSIADFTPALDTEPEVILFGTGIRQIFPPGAVLTDIMRRGIGFEVMDTGAACRTFNVLVAERRRVTAALLVR